jgi:5'/3'-nucleotidase
VKEKKKKNKKPNILASNDDGIDAEGFVKLVSELKKFANVYVSAPLRQQSAVGHAITLYYPLRARKFHREGKFFGMAVEGTPADAVKLGVLFLYKDVKFDLVVSGINHGANTSVNIIYSGTVSAATEGTTLNIPSIAVSLTTFEKADFNYAARISAKIIQNILLKKSIRLKHKTLLNINIPAVPKEQIKGVKVTKQGHKSYWEDSFEVRSDPNGREYYWLTGNMMVYDQGIDYDVNAVKANYISVTPLHYDLTDFRTYEEIKNWKMKI